MAVQTGPFGPNGVTYPTTRDRYGLFSVAERADLPPEAIEGGLQGIVEHCGMGTGYAVVCAPSLATKTFPNTSSYTVSNPFVVYAGRLCGPVGFTEEEQQRLTVAKLKGSEQAIVERVFSEQQVGQSPGLANNANAVTVPILATDNLADAVGRLEEAFYAAYGQQGVLHVPLRTGAHLTEQHLIMADSEHPMPGNSRVWRTALGTAVSIGNYAGSSPTGVPAVTLHQWLYMTPPVKIWAQRDQDIFVAPVEGALNRTTNQETWLAERAYVVGYECATPYAIDATLPNQTHT